MRRLLISSLVVFLALTGHAQNNTTPTYPEIIAAYSRLTSTYPGVCKLEEAGETDSGKPLHLFIIDPSGSFVPEKAAEREKVVCLIMNGIHPGEPCGIDASIAFAKKKAADPDPNVVYCFIPVYNVGGALNRGSHSRANQEGPEEYGFRGNAKNLDLNRDFIKSDSKNALSFARLYHRWSPEVFLDTHTSNGADYQPTLTLISSFPEKYTPMQSTFLTKEFNPYLYEKMEEKGDAMVPYVHSRKGTPDGGIQAFTDLPRYSMGYVSLFNTFGFTTEAHMLKPFDDRVASTLNFLEVLDSFLTSRADVLIEMKRIADAQTAKLKTVKYGWSIGEESDSISFPGYNADTITSAVTGLPQLVYLRDEPYSKNIAYYRYHKSAGEADIPAFYLIPQAWQRVIKRLEANDVHFKRLMHDSLLSVSSVYVDSFKTVDSPYEGHYLHYEAAVTKRRQEVQFYKGDYLIPTGQPAKRYIAQVLTAPAEDSFFNWNFFDAVLMQKEYFSSYVFDATAETLLKRNNTLRKAFEARKKKDTAFAKDARAQLEFIYKNSDYYEDTHRRLPVFGLE